MTDLSTEAALREALERRGKELADLRAALAPLHGLRLRGISIDTTGLADNVGTTRAEAAHDAVAKLISLARPVEPIHAIPITNPRQHPMTWFERVASPLVSATLFVTAGVEAGARRGLTGTFWICLVGALLFGVSTLTERDRPHRR